MEHINSWTEKVAEFTEKYELERSPFLKASYKLVELLKNLIIEEAAELDWAVFKGDELELLDALGDLLYVVIGMAYRLDIPLDEVFNEVHRSNMSKLGADGKPVIDEAGKLQKGENFSPPDFTTIIEKMLAKEQEK